VHEALPFPLAVMVTRVSLATGTDFTANETVFVPAGTVTDFGRVS
jgi:hypothetical protein